jgi:GntR family transcriptional regulator, histidine utilization repressor
MDSTNKEFTFGAYNGMEMDRLEAKPQPLYQKVKNHILLSIAQGRLKPDSRIPSENELVHELNVSRMTVNRALRELTAEGVLVRIQGVGSFVAPHKPQSTLLEIISIAEEIRRRGGVHSSKVHLQQSEQAFGLIAKQMQLTPGSQVFHAVLVHHEDGIPVQLADRYVNPCMAPDFLKQDFNRVTPADYLLQTTAVTEVEHVIEAVSADKKTQKFLKLEANTPCLVMHRTTWADEVVVTCSRFVYSGPRYCLGGRFKANCSVL